MSIDHEVRPTSRPTDVAGVRLRPVQEDDHAWIADLHVQELPHGLFPRLGARFVRRWHRAHVTSPFGVGLVATRAGRPVGFALGSTDRHANVDWIVTHRRRELAGFGLLALLGRPVLAAWFVRTRALTYARRLLRRVGPQVAPAATDGAEPQPTGVAVLDAIVVLPQERTTGVGTVLVDEFLATAAGAGAERVELVTKEGSCGAAGFYERGGWTQVGSHTDRDGDVGLTFSTDPRRRAAR